jgi:hypothetical protein
LRKIKRTGKAVDKVKKMYGFPKHVKLGVGSESGSGSASK